MTHSISERKRLRPRFPFFKDGRAGPISNATLVRILLVLLGVFVVVMGFVAVYVVDLTSRVSRQAAEGHAQRLQFEKEIQAQQTFTQAQVRNLACSVVAFTPPSKSNAFVRSLAATYHCPAYVAPKPGATPNAFITKPPASPAPGASTGSGGGAAQGATQLPGGSAPAPTPTASGPAASSTGQPPNPTPTPTPSATPTSVLCSVTNALLGLCLR